MTDKPIPEFSRIDVRVLQAVSEFASKEAERYYLNGVCLEIDARGVTYIATDGHRLVGFRGLLFGDDPDNGIIGRFIIPTEQCRMFSFGKEDATLAEVYRDDRGVLRIQFGEAGIVFKPIDGHFPDWTKVVPRNVASARPGQFRGDILASFHKFAKSLFLPWPALAHDGPEGAAVVRFGRDDLALGIIMPFKTEDPIGVKLPDWVLRPPTEPEEPELPLESDKAA